MNLLLIGVNHKTAPVEVRERLAVPDARLAEATARLAATPGVAEGLIVSTCNRVEFLACAANGAALDLAPYLRQYFQTDPAAFAPHLYRHEGAAAVPVRHMFRVAASLDSMVVGEPQILGQVKSAYATARAVGAVHSELEGLVTRAFAVAKRVRTETALGTSAVSVASAAVELAQRIFGSSLAGKTVYLVGAGKMAELAARHLLAHGAASIFVANRTHARAVELAQKFGGQAFRWEELYASAGGADILITSTGSPRALFRREQVERLRARRHHRPIFFIDIAVPRDVDPAVNQLEGVFVYDIDDLQSVVAGHVAGRAREAEKAEQIVSEEVARYLERDRARRSTRAVVPTIVSLQEHLETIRQAEVDRVRGRLGPLTAEQELAVEAMTRGIVSKILHTPITTLKTAARAPETAELVDVVRKIFNLREAERDSLGEEPNPLPRMDADERGSETTSAKDKGKAEDGMEESACLRVDPRPKGS